MQAVAEQSPHLVYAEQFAARERSSEPAWLTALRERAMTRFSELGFPSLRLEEWRHTNVAPIAKTPFPPAVAPADVDPTEVAGLLYADCAAVVFVDGRLAPDLSRLDGLEAGVHVASLASELERGEVPELELLGQEVSFEEHAFAALNTALFADGAFVSIAPGAVLERPLQVLYLTSGQERPCAVYPRTLVVAGKSSQGTLIESYAGLAGAPTLTCGVTEIVGRENAVLRHYRVQNEALSCFHVAVQQVTLERSANLRSLAFSLGAALARTDTNARLAGEGIDCSLDGLYLAGGRQHVDHHMRVEHEQPHCSSHELYKGVLDGHARAVFNGRIYVHPGAQKTDAKQTNRNLLLSRDALVQSNPQLEIFADDVRCTHGSTTGRLDEDALFYLRSRGLDLEAARGLLTYAFASELLDRIDVAVVRQDLQDHLVARLPGGSIVRDVA